MLKLYSLWRDFFVSIVLVLILIGISNYLKIAYSLGDAELNIVLTIMAGILGVLVTIATILYTFEDNFKNNPAIKYLKAENKYNEIYKRFTDSITGVFYSVVVVIGVYLFRANFPKEDLVKTSIFGVIVLTFLVFTIFRAYRCFFVFKSLQEAISNYTKRNSF